jgi:tetratricopeptide (TPR) repeat protein
LVQYIGLVSRGVLNIRREKYAAAARDLEEAVKVNPDLVQGYVNLATALQGLGRKEWDRALAMLDKAIQLLPKQPDLHRSRANLHLLRGERAQARGDLEKAIACEPAGSTAPKLANTLVELAKLLQGDKQDREALACCDRALRIQPEFVLAQRFRAEALLALDRPAEAGQALDLYLAKTADPPLEVYQARGLIHGKMGQWPAAIEMYSAVLGRAPKDVKTRRYRGWTYLQEDAVRLALEDFEACLRQEPGDIDAQVGRGKARIKLRQPAEALADAAAAEKLGPLTDRLLYHLTGIYALAAAQAEVEAQAGRDRLLGQRVTFYQDRALTLLRRALEEMPAEQRQAFWREQVETDPALVAIRRGAAYFRLAQQYGRVGL